MNALSLVYHMRDWVKQHRRVKFVFTLDDELHRSLLELAGSEARSVNELAIEMLTFGLAAQLANDEYCWRSHFLTKREHEVVHLVYKGYSCRQIAELLVVSPETVKSHIRNALRKLKLRDKTQLRKILAGANIGKPNL